MILTSTSAQDTSKTETAGQGILISANASLLQSKLHLTTPQLFLSWNWKIKALCKMWNGSEACSIWGVTQHSQRHHKQEGSTWSSWTCTWKYIRELLQWTVLAYGCIKRISSIMSMSLHTNKILSLQSPLLLSRGFVMNKGECVLLFSEYILPKKISTEAAFMSRILVTVLNRFFFISFFPKSN